MGLIVMGTRFLFGVTKCSKITLCPWLHNCEYTKTLWTVYSERLSFMVCELYLNKIIKKRLQEKGITRNKEGRFIIIQEVIYKEDITVINIYAPNNSAST